MRHSGAIVEGGPSTVAPPARRGPRYRGTRRGAQRTGTGTASAAPRAATKWRPEERVPTAFDRAVPLFLTFAAVAVCVTYGFRLGHPDHVVVATFFAGCCCLLQLASLVGAAFVTAMLTAGGFGDLRSALLKFSGIVLACTAAGAVFGQWAGLVANVFTFIALVVYLFDVEPLDATILWFFHIVTSLALTLTAAAVFVG